MTWGHALAVPVITEFMASNDSTLADEDGDFEDWVELHNPDDTPISLSGWYLTDKSDNLTRWRFPAVTLPAGGYLVVFTSGKNRTDPNATLHTNFSLNAGGEYLGLVQPDGFTVASEYAPEFPGQATDVSYGIASGAGGAVGYLAEPSPGQPNGGGQDLVLDSVVTFSTGSTVFAGTTAVSLTGAEGNEVIRYTLTPPSTDGGDTPDPTADSPAYTSPLIISESSVLKAAVFSADGEDHGIISTIQLLEMDSDGGFATQSFVSEMPVVVFDNHGYGRVVGGDERDVEQVGWFYVFEPGVDGWTRLSSGPDAYSLVDMEVRGQSSSLYPKQGFKFDMRDNQGVKTPFEMLDLGIFDEWNLIAPYRWDTAFIRSAYAYGVSNAMGRWAARTRMAEAFFNHDNDGLTMADYHGVVYLADKTDVEVGRIDLVELEESDNDGEAVTGGYLLLMDEAADNKFSWRTERGVPSAESSQLLVDTPKIDELTDAQRSYIVDYVQRMENALYSDSGDGWRYRRHLEYVDRGSWVDHHLLNVLFKNPDAFWRSAYFHKDRGRRLAAGPIWDFDRAFSSNDPRDDDWNTWSAKEFTSQGFAIDYWNHDWWGTIARDPDFMQAWIDRWQSLRAGGALADDALITWMNQYRADVTAAAAARDAAKWPDNVSPHGHHAAELDAMLAWLVQRVAWIDQQWVARPKLTVNSNNSITLTPPAGAALVYTLTGADPRLRNGVIAPDAQVVTEAVTLPVGTQFRARAYDEDRDAFPGSKWSGPIPGEPGAPYAPHPRLTNISSRAALAAGDDVVIAGFVVEEADGTRVLIRGVGPALGSYGVENALADPLLQIFNQDGEQIASNQGWESDDGAAEIPGIAAAVGAFPLEAGSADAATLMTLPAGNYTVHLRSASGAGGTGLIEVYEEQDVGSLLNLSVRGATEGDDNPLVAGFVVQGDAPKRLLIRAIGPSLEAFDVPGFVEDPSLVLRRSGEVVAENDNWSDATNREDIIEAAGYVGAFALEPGTLDAVMLVTVEPGVYTASIFGNENTAGAALVEVYEIR